MPLVLSAPEERRLSDVVSYKVEDFTVNASKSTIEIRFSKVDSSGAIVSFENITLTGEKFDQCVFEAEEFSSNGNGVYSAIRKSVYSALVRETGNPGELA
jgi:hypothetical protein